MNATTTSSKTIFVHSLFRSGSTYFYNALKRTEHFHVYHEPFHEVIGSLPVAWNELMSKTKHLKEALRHDFLGGSYFDEYAHLLPFIKKTFDPSISYDLFFLDESCHSTELISYIDCLIWGSHRQPVFQCTRTIGRIEWLKAHYPSRHIFLLRNPWDQWYSYKVDNYIASTPRIIFSQPRTPTVLTEVMTACDFRPLSNKDLSSLLAHCFSHPIPPEADYFLFFGLWLYAFIRAHSVCDLVLDMDLISSNESAKIDAERNISNIGLLNTNLSDCKLHRSIFTENEMTFYRHIEEQVVEIFRRDSLFGNRLRLATDYLERARGETFHVEPKNADLAGALEDSSRLRAMVIRSENVLARSVSRLDQVIVDRDGQLANLTQILAEREAQIANLNEMVADREGQVASLDQAVVDRDGQLANLTQVLAEREAQIASLDNAVVDGDEQITGLKQVVAELEAVVADRAQVIADRDGQIASLNQAVKERDITQATLQAMRDSRSWRMTAPYRRLGRFIREKLNPNKNATNCPAEYSSVGPDAFFTICSKNFMAYARVLYHSVRPHYPNVRFFVVLCDRLDGMLDPTNEPFEFIYLEDIGLPDLEGMGARYNITEFNTAVKPFVFTHLMDKFGLNAVVYVDPDILLVDRMQELDCMLADGTEAVLTPHILQPAEHDEVHDGKMLLFGIYNLGFLALRNTPNVRNFLGWWGRRLEHDCVIRLEQGLFVDQKWADLLPAFVPGTRAIHHPGYNVAYWNLPQRQIVYRDGSWFANNQPLRFVHFSGNKIDDRKVFSRHSQQVTIKNIGDLSDLLYYYRDQVFAHGHEFYRSLPYAFNWNGENGVNLHTPESLDMSNSNSNGTSAKVSTATSEPRVLPLAKLKARIKLLIRALTVALRLCGGWPVLVHRLWAVYRRDGWAYVKAKVIELSQFKGAPSGLPLSPPESPVALSSPVRRLLYLDWAIPKPDRDAGSVTAVLLMRIFRSLGYAVTFIPCGLKYEKGYFESLVDEGVDVVCYPRIESVESWLYANAATFDICFMARGPVVWPYLATLRKVAPALRLVFYTVDLHYLRELRQAELNGDEKARTAALCTRDHELELVRQCDMTILLSRDELYAIREEVPDASLVVLPIVFQDITGAHKPFAERCDILFIGSFPHLPNIDAVTYFAESVFPLIQKRIPEMHFKIVGSNPPERIQHLATNPNIEVLGFIRDLEPLFENIKISIAPLRYGAGIKGKIGSSFCYGVPCIATSIAVEGMGLVDGRDVLVGDTPEAFADAVCRAYTDEDLWNYMSYSGHRFAVENYSFDVVRERVRGLLWALQDGWCIMESAVEIDSWSAWQDHRERMGAEYEKRVLREEALLPLNGTDGFHTSGFCCVCGRETSFITSFMYSTGKTPDGRPMPNWREHLQCGHCGLVNRVRAALHAFYTMATPSVESRIYVTEQVTPLYGWLHDRHANVQGSEFLGNEFAPGTMIDRVRHEDIMRLSFNDASFDRVLSLDVLEHIPDPKRALNEIFRILCDGGIFIFTVPFANNSATDLIRASVNADGSVVHHLPPEYHGNPVDAERGSLCFRYFGWELLDVLRSIGFVRVHALAYWSEKQGYLGCEQYLFITQKPIEG